MNDRPLVIAAALRLEARAVTRSGRWQAAGGCTTPGNGGRARAAWACGTLGARACALVRTGPGLAAAARGAAATLDALPAAAGIVVVGICGALAPSLAVGDVVVPEAVADEAGERWSVDGALHARLSRGAPGGLALSVARPARTSAAKHALHARFGAVICEMEAAAWAAAATARGLPFAMVRAVSDGAIDDLPAMGRLADPTASRWTLARLLDPRLVWRLPGLARRAARASAAAAAHLQGALA